MLYEWTACNSLAKAILELSFAEFLRPRFTLEPQTIDRHPWGFMATCPTLPRYKHVTIEEGISFRAADVATPAEFAMVIQWKPVLRSRGRRSGATIARPDAAAGSARVASGRVALRQGATDSQEGMGAH
jgi:hypothetical protein